MESAFKFFGITLNCLYAYFKILNIRDVSKLKIVFVIIFSTIMGVTMSLLQSSYPSIRLTIMLVSIFIFTGITTKIKTDIRTTTIVISCGLSYGVLTFTLVIALFLLRLIAGTINTIFALSLSFISSVAFINILFRIKRLKKGFIFLQTKEDSSIGLIISAVIIISAGLIGIKDVKDSIAMLSLIGIGISTIGIIFWWRYNLTKLYKQRLIEGSVQEYKAILAEKDKQLQKAYECNDYLSKVIHRDNKLIPAMYYAVRDFLASAPKSADEEVQINGARILNELDEVMKERSEMILNNQRKFKTLQSTKVDCIDNILNFMLLKASEKEIQFDFAMTDSVTQMTEDIIPKHTLEILLADLIENAVIATSYSIFKKILVTIGIVDNCYEINVQDSGIPFEREMLINLGLKRVTTHASDGGSGIGYMSAFESLLEYKASLIIIEYPPNKYAFSKSVKIRFNGNAEYTLHSFRARELKMNIERADMLILEHA